MSVRSPVDGNGDGAGRSRRRSIVDLLLEEAVSLAEDTRDYMLSKRAEPRNGAGLDRLCESAELGRITSRLGFSIAWLLARKAVQAGELTREQGREDDQRLGGRGICDQEGHLPAAPSPLLLRLSRQSHSLYARVDRMDGDLGAAG